MVISKHDLIMITKMPTQYQGILKAEMVSGRTESEEKVGKWSC